MEAQVVVVEELVTLLEAQLMELPKPEAVEEVRVLMSNFSIQVLLQKVQMVEVAWLHLEFQVPILV
jgi:hypothetical protein